MFKLFKKKKQVQPPPKKRSNDALHGIKGMAASITDPDIEWFCDGSETGAHTEHITATHTGKGDWAQCTMCGHVHARRRRLDRVTVIKTAFCKATVQFKDVTAGFAICPACKCNEPVLATTKDVEQILGLY
jgi:hypothetical protein